MLTLYWIIALPVVLFYTVFAPEAFFYNTDRYNQKGEKIRMFERWRIKSIFWNLHQSFIHLIGSLIGFICIYRLIFIPVDNTEQIWPYYLVIFFTGIAGIMGYIPSILFRLEAKPSK